MKEIQTIAINIWNLQFCLRVSEMKEFLLNPKEKCYNYDSDKYAKFNGLQIFVTLFIYFFYKTLKLQLGVYICDHTNRLKLTTNKQCI